MTISTATAIPERGGYSGGGGGRGEQHNTDKMIRKRHIKARKDLE